MAELAEARVATHIQNEDNINFCLFNHQETDIAAAALKMTAEREEVIDFIAPYYEQTGISIGEKCLCTSFIDIKLIKLL